MLKLNKRKFSFFLGSLIIFILAIQFCFIFNIVYAQTMWDVVKEGGIEEIGEQAFGGKRPLDPRDIAVIVVRAFLGFMAIIFVILIIIAGYSWMTAAGNEDTIKKAKSQIRSAIIGLIIILIALGITELVLGELRRAIFDMVW